MSIKLLNNGVHTKLMDIVDVAVDITRADGKILFMYMSSGRISISKSEDCALVTVSGVESIHDLTAIFTQDMSCTIMGIIYEENTSNILFNVSFNISSFKIYSQGENSYKIVFVYNGDSDGENKLSVRSRSKNERWDIDDNFYGHKPL